jgi:hypothetical protein
MLPMSNDQVPPEMLKLIASRLRPACPDIPKDEFESLVVDVARVKMKYDRDRFASFHERAERDSARIL